ncbi:MAG: M3 family metallopeptidase [Planctomycetota bacterium]
MRPPCRSTLRTPLLLALLVSTARGQTQEDDSPIAAALERANATLDEIAAVPTARRNYQNTVLAMDDVQARVFMEARMTGFLAQVSTDPDERARGDRAALHLSNWYSELYKREDLYRALVDFEATEPELGGGEGERFLGRLLRDYRRSGMELPAADRARLLAIDRELTELGIQFRSNIDEDESVLLLTPEECAGVPQAFLDSLPVAAGLYVARLSGPVAGYFFGDCEVQATRRKMSIAYSRRGGRRNVDVLEKMLRLRSEQAHLLGYPHIADYVTETRMAQSAAAVWAFYDDLRPKLRKKALQDLAEFQDAKRTHTKDPEAVLEAWDFSFYRNWLMKEKYAVDTKVVRDYFPLDQVTKGLFSVTQELFGLRYVEITERARAAGRTLWHEDVKLFEVWDRETQELLGEFYTDLHPRPGKYTHAAQFPLVLRKRWSDGELTRPLVALVTNFTKPTAEQPSLLSHREVQTYFHEFGHCLHTILSEGDLAEFSGTAVARDFVEAPSQMLENWVWDAEVLARFARHHETGEPLSEEILAGMIAAKNLGSGLSTEGQVFLGLLDMTYHTDEDGELDTTAVRREVYGETRLFPAIDNIFGQASFGHLVGYHAGYYGYLWSLVYAQDMFSRFEAEGIMNPVTAREYRELILARGGTVDALDMVREFLGREPNSKAFLKHLGLE